MTRKPTSISSGRTASPGTWSSSAESAAPKLAARKAGAGPPTPPGLSAPFRKTEAVLSIAKIGFVTCVHPIYNLPSVTQHRDAAVDGLRGAGCEVIAPAIAR